MNIQSVLLRFIGTALLLLSYPALSLDGNKAGNAPASTASSISKVSELFCRAMERNNYEMMDTLLAQGADVNAASCTTAYDKTSPLIYAIKDRAFPRYQDTRNIFVYLIDHGADVNARTVTGTTPLIEAVTIFNNAPKTSTYLVDLLISKGARVESVDRNDHTALDYLAASGYSSSTFEFWKKGIYLLLDNGAKINRQDRSGETVLMRSASGCGVGAVELMLASGANPELVNKKGERAYDYALEGASNSSRNMMASCNEVVRILAQPVSYMKERAASAGPVSQEVSTGAEQNGPAKAPPLNVLDALNLLGRVLR